MNPKLKKILTLSPYMAGVITAVSIYSLFMDFHGLEGWIEHCREHWVSGTITGPLAVAFFLWACWSYLQSKEASGGN